VTTAAMTNDAIGSYYYDYLISSAVGVYKAQIKATGTTGRVTIKTTNFVVEAAI
jgi:sugar/nucleoside kinase (ribokinase family)